MTNFKGLVIRNSNGSIQIEPIGGGNVPGKIEQGSEIDITIEVLRTPEEIEADTAKAKAKRAAPSEGEEPPRAATKKAAAK
jgi:hypothetical protein